MPSPPNAYLELSGLEPFIATPDINFINIGERTNVTGSKKFARLIKENNYEEALKVAAEQVENGAQILDVNMDDALLNGEEAMTTFLNILQSEPSIARIPIMVDSSKFSIIEAGLKCVQGKCIVNSISLKEGEESFLRYATTCLDYGAAVIVMAFDEEGQADTIERRIRICERAYHLLTTKVGYPPQDIIFDLNVFAVATGIDLHNNYAVDFIEAAKEVKKRFPLSKISGGLSNLSFSFRGNDIVREAMHSIFLYYAIKAGMDMAIVNAGQLPIYDNIESELKRLCEDVILNRSPDATEKLVAYAQQLKSTDKNPKKTVVNEWRSLPIQERISRAIAQGISDYIEEDVEELYSRHGIKPIRIIEENLMEGMNIVGDLFGAGKMFLPQVVKSARVMKKAVAYLEPYILQEKTNDALTKQVPKILLATVKGDVHDIGKNIVGVVLGCNGYEVIDLGVMVPCSKIIEEIKNHKVDIVGLSGLITPSLDEMIYVAQEMSKHEITIPLLIGGATTSRIHTAIKINPHYAHGVVHVVDASKSIPILAKLVNQETKPSFLASLNEEYEKIKTDMEKKQFVKERLPIEKARENKFKAEKKYLPVAPTFLGNKPIENVSIKELRPYIDWNPFFISWEMKGKYPAILEDAIYGESATQLLQDANDMLDTAEKEGWFRPKGVVGFWRAKAQSDDIFLTEKNRLLCHLRQQQKKTAGQPNLCLSDFISSTEEDYLGGFLVTMGKEIEEHIRQYDKQKDDYRKILLQSLADRLVEAFAEYAHEKVRKEWWKYARDENVSAEDLIKENYQGIRPAPGYPACPDHTEKLKLFSLLESDTYTDVALTESLAMYPASSICGWYFSHPESKYFGINHIEEDQLLDYVKRKEMPLEELRKWLSPLLSEKSGA